MEDYQYIYDLLDPQPDITSINVKKIRRLCAVGLSECPPEVRCITWLVLLKVYPHNPHDWETTKAQILKLYQLFICEYGLDNWHNTLIESNPKKESFPVQEQSIMSIIHGDILRTGRLFYFLPPEEIPPNANPDSIMSPFIYHIRRLERILYIFSSTNPVLKYMQGFNELLIPLYYVAIMAKQLFNNDIDVLEAITFQMFLNLLTTTDLQEFYSVQDQSRAIINKMKVFDNLIKDLATESFVILETLSINPLLYAFRWFNLLFAQEHELPVLLIIWDAIFSHIEQLGEFSFYIGVAHVKNAHRSLDINSFPKTISALQNVMVSNIISLLKDANQMLKSMHKCIA